MSTRSTGNTPSLAPAPDAAACARQQTTPRVSSAPGRRACSPSASLPGPPSASPAAAATTAAPDAAAGDRALPPLAIDPSLELPVEVQQRVVEFEAQLARPYHEILGVAADADVRAIKQAYFGLSKQFHPDRYFRRNLGPYAPRIERIFKKVLEAYELLSDPTTRAEVQGAQAAGATGAPAPLPDAASARRLRARLSTLTRHRRALDGRKQKAKSFFESGMAASPERWSRRGSVSLAIAFDPGTGVQGRVLRVQRRAHEERARVLLRSRRRELARRWRVALPLYEEALHYRFLRPSLWREDRALRSARGAIRKAKEDAPPRASSRPTGGRTVAPGHVYKARAARPTPARFQTRGRFGSVGRGVEARTQVRDRGDGQVRDSRPAEDSVVGDRYRPPGNTKLWRGHNRERPAERDSERGRLQEQPSMFREAGRQALWATGEAPATQRAIRVRGQAGCGRADEARCRSARALAYSIVRGQNDEPRIGSAAGFTCTEIASISCAR